MSMPDGDVTCLLREWRNGRADALDQLMPLVYQSLLKLAGQYMRGESARHTLQPTALVNEAYLRLAKADTPFVDRVHFFAVAATVMRHILLDWARSRQRVKRGQGAVLETLKEEHHGFSAVEPETILEIDRLLDRLSSFDARKAKVVEMIFFGGMTYDEVATALNLTAVTVHRDLKMAKAWMRTELTASPAVPPT